MDLAEDHRFDWGDYERSVIAILNKQEKHDPPIRHLTIEILTCGSLFYDILPKWENWSDTIDGSAISTSIVQGVRAWEAIHYLNPALSPERAGPTLSEEDLNERVRRIKLLIVATRWREIGFGPAPVGVQGYNRSRF